MRLIVLLLALSSCAEVIGVDFDRVHLADAGDAGDAGDGE